MPWVIAVKPGVHDAINQSINHLANQMRSWHVPYPCWWLEQLLLSFATWPFAAWCITVAAAPVSPEPWRKKKKKRKRCFHKNVIKWPDISGEIIFFLSEFSVTGLARPHFQEGIFDLHHVCHWVTSLIINRISPSPSPSSSPSFSFSFSFSLSLPACRKMHARFHRLHYFFFLLRFVTEPGTLACFVLLFFFTKSTVKWNDCQLYRIQRPIIVPS